MSVSAVKNFVFKIMYRTAMLFPVQKKVFFSSFSGKRYGDSPKYISEKLHELYPDVQIVWQRHFKYQFDVPDYVKLVKSPGWSSFYEQATSKIWVDSHLKRHWMPKRKNQYLLETWHGGLGFKKIQMDVSASDAALDDDKKSALHTAAIADVFLSNSDWISDIYQSGFQYKGEILKCGFPKNDVFFREQPETVRKIKRVFNIPEEKAVILYAPTFRDDKQSKAYDIDFQALITAFRESFHKDCVVLVRMHPLMIKEAENFYSYDASVINATGYSDSQEILLASDALITDYSSIVFDFMLMRRPAFLFVPDLKEYEQERGFYQPMSYYPFSYALDNQELCRNIRSFENEAYQKKTDAFILKVGLHESGCAAETAVKKIIAWMEE